MAKDEIGRMIGNDRVGTILVGDGAQMSVPIGNWLWQLRYTKEPERSSTICDDRMLAAGVMESYMYLIEDCSKDEAWRRIRIMREAIKAARAVSMAATEAAGAV